MRLLHIDSSILGDHSVSRSLSAGIVAQQKKLHPGIEVTYLDLAANPPLHLSPAHIGAMFGHTPTDPAVLADIEAAGQYITDLFAADIIVIGAPMYNFTVPTQLKAWIDRILVAGKTFKYTAAGPEGLIPPGKKVFIASSRGGIHSEGSPTAHFDHQEKLLVSALGLTGLTDVTIVRAEGTAIPELKEPALAAAQAQIAALAA